MDLKFLKFKILHGSTARRVILRGIMVASTLSIIPLLQMLSGSGPVTLTAVSYNDCSMISGNANPYLIFDRILYPIFASFESMHCKETANLTNDVVKELMGMQLLSNDAKTLCVDQGSPSLVYALRELGFRDVCGVIRHPFFSLKHKKFVYELVYKDNSFDFVFTKDLDKVSVPALLVLEIERVLKPGGIGAVLVGAGGLSPNSLIRSATPVSSIIKSSTIVHVRYVNEFTLVVFKKRVEENVVAAPYFEQNQLPADCQSLQNNEPYVKFLEPLMEKKPIDYAEKIAYLPKFMDISSRKRLVYIDIGAGEHLQSGSSTNWFLPSYPVDRKAFSIYFVDHNTSVLLSYVKKPGVTFVYHPDLAGSRAAVDPDDSDDFDSSLEDEGFDFLLWFKETVQYADYVVLKMNAGEMELRFLSELFKTGTICFVDELFLRCSDGGDEKGPFTGGSCMKLFRGLRSNGVFVHQWWEDRKD